MKNTTEDRLDRIESAIMELAVAKDFPYDEKCRAEVIGNILYPKKPLTLAQKFQEWRNKSGSGKGDHYWEGLAKIAEKHFAVYDKTMDKWEKEANKGY